MVLKKSNLCLSADVNSAEELVHLAATIGPSIVVLKTHFDILGDWDSHPRHGTGAQLSSLARRHGFLIFEDRKFSDIGSTVQKQYTDGPGKIVEWAHITNAHILPGPAIVTALAEAASQWRDRKKCEVRTDIGVGTPRPESETEEEKEEEPTPRVSIENHDTGSGHAGRKASIVSITTVSHSYEPNNSEWASTPAADEERFPGIEEPLLHRGLLLLAQMSSAGNLLDEKYAQTCVDIARNNKDFVMGYIAQESLNTSPGDQFLSMTPGCQLPPGDETEVKGDGLGQQYNTPKKLVGLLGTDIIIVGRGIIKATDPVAEAERYREKGWEAYEERIAS
jgi:uridine monophosphate synthetase